MMWDYLSPNWRVQIGQKYTIEENGHKLTGTIAEIRGAKTVVNWSDGTRTTEHTRELHNYFDSQRRSQ